MSATAIAVQQARPKAVESDTEYIECGCGGLFAILGRWGGGVKEVFVKLGSQGSCSAAVTNALAITVSICLRSGVPAPVIAEALQRDTGLCHQAGAAGTCIVAMGRILTEYVGQVSDEEMPAEPMKLSGTERKRLTGCGHVEVICLDDSEGGLRKVRAELGRGGTCAHTVTRAVSHLVTIGLAYGVTSEQIAKGVGGISCPASNCDSSSCLDAIARAIVMHEAAKVQEGGV